MVTSFLRHTTCLSFIARACAGARALRQNPSSRSREPAGWWTRGRGPGQHPPVRGGFDEETQATHRLTPRPRKTSPHVAGAKRHDLTRWARSALAAVVVLAVVSSGSCLADSVDGLGHGGAASIPAVPHVLWSSPFVLLLLAIAVLPLVPVAHHWWERNEFKLAVGLTLGAIVLSYYGLRSYGYHGEPAGWRTVKMVLSHAVLRDYVPFMVLISSLFVISGGLQLRGDLRAWPAVNTAFLGLGALLASVIGTTGASMLLIRPLLQTNRDREHVRHTVVFFIFLVSNVGGSLLPTGDPPLFLGYLNGVPFLWTCTLVVPWLFTTGVLLAIYYLWDKRAFKRETREHLAADVRHTSPLRLHGSINLLWLLGVILAVGLIVPGRAFPGTDIVAVDFAREAVMIVLMTLSVATTPRGLRKETEYSNAAIIEVACLFLGIFLTMQVPIEILQVTGASLGLNTPAHFFWSTGFLSSFLDNAPTYLVFFETAKTLPIPSGANVVSLMEGAIRRDLLAAISLGAVFMGANTYIGNAPNLMVKLIAEQRGVKMPSFFGYMLYSGCVLIPVFALVSMLFFG
jgi:Na+/H+ antiporter NhaD/arsenite permease-like protein